MGILKLERLPAVLRTGDAPTRVFLIYGPNAGRVRETARSIVMALAGSDDDPFTVTRLSEEDIAADPGRLVDEVNGISFGGGTRTVWVTDAGTATTRALGSLLEGPVVAGVVVVESAALTKSGALRVLIEKSDLGLAIACYEEESDSLASVISGVLKDQGFTIDPEALAFLCARLGNDRLQARSEVNKLVIFCQGQSSIGLEDVEAVCSDGQTGTIDRLMDTVMEGHCDLAMRTMDELDEAGAYPAALLSALAGHIARLRSLHVAAAKVGPDQAVRSARPPIYFKRQSSHARQLRVWSPERVQAAADTVFEAVLQTRRFSQLDRIIAERAVLALAMRAQRLRRA